MPLLAAPKRILVIEDNPKVAEILASALGEQGFVVEIAFKGIEGEVLAMRGNFDLITLDIMLPDRDGFDVCRNLRRNGVLSPILIVSALAGTSDVAQGLDAGGDDYLRKPFEFEELFARIRALFRRTAMPVAGTLCIGDTTIDLNAGSLRRGKFVLPLDSALRRQAETLSHELDRALARASRAGMSCAAKTTPDARSRL